MAKTATELEDLARAGGGMSLDATQYSTPELLVIARAASIYGVTIVLRQAAAKPTADLKALAQASPGNFIFEL